MIVVISNKLKNIIDATNFKEEDCKYAIGCYLADDCINTLSNYPIDYLVIDITAIKDAFEISTWKKFRDFFDPSKTIILLEGSKSYSNVGFLSMLITMGFYNFTKTGEGIIRMMQNPNTYQEVVKYQKMAMNLNERKEDDEGRISDYHRKIEENQVLMQDYLEKNQAGEVPSPKKNSILSYQIKIGLIVLPILTFICVFMIYCFQVLVSNYVPATGDYLGEYLYGELAHTGFTPLTLIGIILAMVIFSIYYVVLNANVKRKQMTRSKFIVIPFAIYCVIMFSEYYLIGILENLYEFIKFFPIDNKPYLFQDLYGLSRWVATAAIFLYYASTFVNNSKTLKFERDLGQNLTKLEKVWVVVMILLLVVPLAYQLSGVLPTNNSISRFFTKLYDQPLVMMLISGIEFILTILILIQPKFMKEKEYTILKEEDL